MGACITILAAPASMLTSRSLLGTRQELAGLLSGSLGVDSDGFDIQVGRSVGAQTTYIPQCVLDSCPILRKRLLPGCRVVNADPAIFAIIINHLQSVVNFGLISFSSPGRLLELTLGDDPLLDFAKAWHILDMLRKPTLQDGLLKVYRTYYLDSMSNRTQHQQEFRHLESRPIDSGPFVYLRNHVGYHSKAEKFLIDFHAGLMQKQTELKRDDFKLLPPEIGALIRNRWLELCGRVRKDSHHSDLDHDRIVARDSCYRVTKNEAIQHEDLQIQYLYGGAGTTFGLNPAVSTSPHSELHGSRKGLHRHNNRGAVLLARRSKSQATHSSASATPRPSPADSAEYLDLPSTPKFGNPFEASTPTRERRKPSTSISPFHLPSGHDAPAIERRSSIAVRSGRRMLRNQASCRSSVSFASDLPSRAPFTSNSPNRGSGSRDADDVAATGGESVYQLFAPNLRGSDLSADQSQEVRPFGVLDFAA